MTTLNPTNLPNTGPSPVEPSAELGPGFETEPNPEVELLLAQDMLLARIDAAMARTGLDESRTDSTAIRPYQSSNPSDWKGQHGEHRTVRSNLTPIGSVATAGNEGTTYGFIEFFETETVGTTDIRVPNRNKEIRPKIQNKLINNKVVPKAFRGMKHRPVNHLSTPAPATTDGPYRQVEKMGVRMFMSNGDDLDQIVLVGEYSLELLTPAQRDAIESGEATDQVVDDATLASRDACLARINWLMDINDTAIEKGFNAPTAAPVGVVAVAANTIFGGPPARPIRN